MVQSTAPVSSSRFPFWLGCLAALVAGWLLGLAMRLLELPGWHTPGMSVLGAPLMVTHDAYAWLAGATGFGRYAAAPLSRLLAGLATLTGSSPAQVGFWLPVLAAPLVALPVVWLACRWCGAAFAPAAGILAACAFGYLIRTRLGEPDTDLYSLTVVTGLAAGLAVAVERGVRPWMAGALGLAGWLVLLLYPSARPVLLALFAVAALLAVVLPRGEAGWRRLPRAAWLVLAAAMALAGVSQPGALLGLVLVVLAARFRAGWFTGYRGALLLVMLAAAVVVFLEPGSLERMATTVKDWWRPAEESVSVGTGEPGGPPLESVLLSVREAKGLGIASLGLRLAGHWLAALAGLAGFAWLCLRRPAALILLPLVLLGLAGMRLGNRFTMYAAPGLGLGLAFLGLQLAAWWGRVRVPFPRVLAGLLVAAAALVPNWLAAERLVPVPALPSIYAENLAALRHETQPTAWLWVWWDYGYAAQYFARRATFADGGRIDPVRLRVLARVHGSQDPMEASRQMLATAAAMRLADPADPLAVEPLLESPAGLALENHSPQLLVLSWENLRLGSWIMRYAGTPARLDRVDAGSAVIDAKRGILAAGDLEPTPLAGLSEVGPQGVRSLRWAEHEGPGALYAVTNSLSREIFIMDGLARRSNMVRMLLDEPVGSNGGSAFPGFELVQDDFPWNRVWRAVKQ